MVVVELCCVVVVVLRCVWLWACLFMVVVELGCVAVVVLCCVVLVSVMLDCFVVLCRAVWCRVALLSFGI